MAALFGERGMAAWFKFINAGIAHMQSLIVKIQTLTRRVYANSKDEAIAEKKPASRELDKENMNEENDTF
jgi:hypothetical protein